MSNANSVRNEKFDQIVSGEALFNSEGSSRLCLTLSTLVIELAEP